MKQRRIIAWMLVVVSIVMLAASVLPHHHHQDFLCMHSKSAACECNSGYVTHHPAGCSHGGHQACDLGCITNFQTVAPDDVTDGVSPDDSFCSLVYAIADIISVPLPLLHTRTAFSIPYSEMLHPACIPHVMGLRAPPFILA